MSTRRFLVRIERMEQAARAKLIFAPECICFPENRSICFHWPIEQDIAATIKCPLHGERFQRQFLVYAAKWLRAKREKFVQERTSKQFQKAWYASFPPALWPAEEESVENKVFLKLKDGTRLLANGVQLED